MFKLTRRKFIVNALRVGTAVWAVRAMESKNAFCGNQKLEFNVGYLPITDHLILPVSHALDNYRYDYINVNPYLCRSWDEMLGKVDMGLLDAAFMLAPLAMHKVWNGFPMKCMLLGHTNGSVIATKPSIKDAKELEGKTIGIPHSRSTHRLLLYKYFKTLNILDSLNTRLVKIPPSLTVHNLKLGIIDAYSVAEPWGMRGVSEGAANILEFSKNIIPDHACCIVMMKNRVVNQHPVAVSEWIESLIRAGRLIHDDPEHAGLIQKPYMRLNTGEIVQLIKKDLISYKNLYPDKKKLDALRNLAVECGILPLKFNLNQFIDTSFV
jgi:NitT/TauT family transport system substrate-binding protein